MSTKRETKPTTKEERNVAALKELRENPARLEPMGGVDININSKHDAISETLAMDAITPNGFLPDSIRNLLLAAIRKTD